MLDKLSVVTISFFPNLGFILLHAVFPLVGCEGKKRPYHILPHVWWLIPHFDMFIDWSHILSRKSIKHSQNWMKGTLTGTLNAGKRAQGFPLISMFNPASKRTTKIWPTQSQFDQCQATGIIFFHGFTKDLFLVLQFPLSFVVFHLHGLHKDLLRSQMAVFFGWSLYKRNRTHQRWLTANHGDLFVILAWKTANPPFMHENTAIT